MKLSKAERRLLELLAKDAEATIWVNKGLDISAFLTTDYNMRIDSRTPFNLWKRGYLEDICPPAHQWHSYKFRLTDAGARALAGDAK